MQASIGCDRPINYKKEDLNAVLKAEYPMLRLSASLRGFFLVHFRRDYAEYMTKLITLFKQNKIVSTIDMGEKTPSGPFIGLDRVTDAVEYMYSGKNIGKIVVELPK
nr:hypothetical protein BaRGS_012703 [Batillaria attramentaria]